MSTRIRPDTEYNYDAIRGVLTIAFGQDAEALGGMTGAVHDPPPFSGF